MAERILPSADVLRALLDYDPSTGVLTWRVRVTQRIKAGDRAGSQHPDGYRTICIRGAKSAEHRVIWCWMTGEWPEQEIDHINGIKNDNRFCNLREATRAENNRNQRIRRDASLGVKGISLHYKKYRVRIQRDGERHTVGSFTTMADVVRARRQAIFSLHGEFSNAG